LGLGIFCWPFSGIFCCPFLGGVRREKRISITSKILTRHAMGKVLSIAQTAYFCGLGKLCRPFLGDKLGSVGGTLEKQFPGPTGQ